jgi:hypothetical protein
MAHETTTDHNRSARLVAIEKDLITNKTDEDTSNSIIEAIQGRDDAMTRLRNNREWYQQNKTKLKEARTRFKEEEEIRKNPVGDGSGAGGGAAGGAAGGGGIDELKQLHELVLNSSRQFTEIVPTVISGLITQAIQATETTTQATTRATTQLQTTREKTSEVKTQLERTLQAITQNNSASLTGDTIEDLIGEFKTKVAAYIEQLIQKTSSDKKQQTKEEIIAQVKEFWKGKDVTGLDGQTEIEGIMDAVSKHYNGKIEDLDRTQVELNAQIQDFKVQVRQFRTAFNEQLRSQVAAIKKVVDNQTKIPEESKTEWKSRLESIIQKTSSS